MKNFDTIAVHAGREDLTKLGVHAVPLDFSTTYPISTLDAGGVTMDRALEGNEPLGHELIYRRIANPNVQRFEQAITALETSWLVAEAGARAEDYAGVAFASGMAAITAVLHGTVVSGLPHVVGVRPVYGTTDHVLEIGLMGNEISWTTVDAIKDEIRPDTGLVYVESPANPTMNLLDIEEVVRAAGNVPVLVDNTFATPVLQQPLLQGATYVVHSATKYIGGHGDAMGGVVVTTQERAKTLRQVRVGTGGLMDPLTAYLMHRGLTTIGVRVRAAQETAKVVADWLTKQPQVKEVFYPGLAQFDQENLVGPKSQMRGPGTMLAFDVAGGFTAAAKIAQSVKLITHAVSLGGVDTLIEHPASFTHRMVNPDARPHQAVLRMAIGLEHPDDLIADLTQAFSGV